MCRGQQGLMGRATNGGQVGVSNPLIRWIRLAALLVAITGIWAVLPGPTGPADQAAADKPSSKRYRWIALFILTGLVLSPAASAATVVVLAAAVVLAPPNHIDRSGRDIVVVIGFAAGLVLSLAAGLLASAMATSQRWNEREGGQLRSGSTRYERW
jgi:hypothetical protein